MARNFTCLQASGSAVAKLQRASGAQERRPLDRRSLLPDLVFQKSPLWLSEGLLSPSHSCSSRLFSLAVTQAQPHYEEQTWGAVGCDSMDPGWGRGRGEGEQRTDHVSLEGGESALRGNLASEMRDLGGDGRGNGCTGARWSLVRPRTNTGHML